MQHQKHLVVQWLRLHHQRRQPGIPGQGTRSHMPQLQVCMMQLKILHTATKTQCSQVNNKYLKKYIPDEWVCLEAGKWTLVPDLGGKGRCKLMNLDSYIFLLRWHWYLETVLFVPKQNSPLQILRNTLVRTQLLLRLSSFVWLASQVA